ncbi:MAG: DUF1501 domain-containing protein, partial [Planctomycetota bacterium]
MNPRNDRRHWLSRVAMGIGGIAAGDLMMHDAAASSIGARSDSPLGAGIASTGMLNATHHTPTAKRVIYLFQSGGPSQLETWDDKPLLRQKQGQALPDSVRGEQRLTGMSGNQAVLALAGSKFKFNQHGENGTWISELLPHTAKCVDDIAVIRSMHTEAINHDPAITFFQTGNQIAGRPSIGSWLSYGLGSDNDNLPSFVVLVTKGKGG